MKLSEIEQPHLKAVLTEMFSRVNADTEIDIKQDGWFLKHQWSRQQELSFINWLTDYLKTNGAVKEFSSVYRNNFKNRQKIAEGFVMNYGWKTVRL